MLKSSIDCNFFTRSGFIALFIRGVRLKHALSAALPGVLQLLKSVGENAWRDVLGLSVSVAVLTFIMFQSLGLYPEELFINRLRFRVMLVALFFWLALFGIERLLLPRLFHPWMASGKYLRR